MAIDKNRTQDLIKDVEKLFDDLATITNLPQDTVRNIRDTIMGSAFDVIGKLVSESRPPVLFLFGRTGHGKSSLINSLANKEVADVGDIKPTTRRAERYTVTFEDVFSTWDIIDSRGVFESTPAEGASEKTSTEQVKEDIARYNPDVIVHVINASEVRSCQKDFEFFEEVLEIVKTRDGELPPIFMVLTKVDILGNPTAWPPEKYAKKAGNINDLLDYTSNEVLKANSTPLNLNNPTFGMKITESKYSAIIPVSTQGNTWNIDTLIEYIAEKLPTEAKLNFYQALRRKDLLRKMANSIVTRFTALCCTLGSVTIIPVSDIFILTPLQMLMVSIIGGLSCKPLSLDTAREYFSSIGITGGAAIALRYLAQQVVKLIPGFSMPISGLIAASGTYAIGKSAELYFFAGQIKKPDQIDEKYKPEKALPDEL